MEEKYLSDCIDLQDLQTGKLNVIVAGCGAGKTHFCIHKLATYIKKYSTKDLLFLIDGRIAKDQLVQGGEVQYGYDKTGKEIVYLKYKNVSIYTYAGFMTFCENNPELDGWQSEDAYIVCDELQNCINFSKFETSGVHKRMLTRLHNAIGRCTVISISATPSKIFEEFKDEYYVMPLHGKVRSFKTEEIIPYSQLSMLCKQIAPGSKGIIYTPHIRSILRYQEMLEQRGIRTGALWSQSNEEHPLSDEQYALREYIINNKKVPDDIDVLLINASAETSISIGGNIEFIICHSTNQDVQTQVRGRYRADLSKLYVYAPNTCEQEIILDDKWLNKMLFSADKKELCAELNITDPVHGSRTLKWGSIKKLLEANDYSIYESHCTLGRYAMIS